MERRVTRSMTASQRLAALAENKPVCTEATPNTAPKTVQRKKIRKAKAIITDTKPAHSVKTDGKTKARKQAVRRRKRRASGVIKGLDINDLPHNLGKASQAIVKAVPVNAFKEKQQESQDTKPVDLGKRDEIEEAKVQTKTKEKPTTAPYGLTPGVSPFPDWPHPTPEECEEVNRLLSSVHGEVKAPAVIPEPSLTVTGCGEVPSVLDALIRTLLSGATNSANSAKAFQGLVEKFGILEEGIGKGSVNWDAVRRAPVEEVFQAMRSGGLAATKSKYIKEILDMVYQENQARKAAAMRPKKPDGIVDALPDAVKQDEFKRAEANVLSLDYLHSLDKEQAMMELIKFPGIGPKTAACVILFCLQRPCFAVDTHIFRICKWLGWVPTNGKGVTEITMFRHLEVRIPDHLKYSLHQLFIFHGKSCPRCRAITAEGSDGWEDGCVIDHLVKRTGRRKNQH
ncbi:hypothetical protein VTN31DRAFT_26 [Thermomyces dupontii]|uniref:uncharacterized protein n=1 Tax=Talaromyces thermophilus TaxID=28565 RepID=UPI0037433CF2